MWDKWGMRIDGAELCPGIIQSGTEQTSKADIKDRIMPKLSVRISDRAIGATEFSGIALALIVALFMEYM